MPIPQAVVERVGTDALPAVFIDVGTPVLEVGAVLGMLHRAGLRRMLLVSASDEPRRLPQPPRAVLADELRASLPAEPGARTAAAGEQLLEAVADGPGAATAVADVVATDPDSCAALAEALGDTLPTCLLTDVDSVVTIAQVMFEPPGPNAFTATMIDLDPSAPLLEADADTVWGDHAERLRTPLWMAGAASDEQLQASCDTGKAEACWKLGHRLLQADTDKARFLWKLACDRDHRDSCGDLAQLLGAEAEDEQGLEAIEVAKLACELESGLGCSLLGEWTRDGALGLDADADADAAATWLEKACALGHDDACD